MLFKFAGKNYKYESIQNNIIKKQNVLFSLLFTFDTLFAKQNN